MLKLEHFLNIDYADEQIRIMALLAMRKKFHAPILYESNVINY